MRLSDKQFGSIREATAQVNLWHGAIRSGKTIGSLIRWLLFVAAAPSGGALVIVGRTRDSAWRNVIAPLQDSDLMGPAAAHVVGNYGAPTVSILGRMVYIMGASDVKAELVLRGLTVAGAYVDEVTTLPEGFFTQLLGRMSVRGAKLFGTTNPDNPAHWLKVKFLDRLGDLCLGRPDVLEVDGRAVRAAAERFVDQVDVDAAGQGVGHHQRRRGQEVGLDQWVDASLEVAIPRNDGRRHQV